MMLWVVFGALAVVAVVFLLVPLRGRDSVGGDRDEGAIAILADQLKEVESEAARGLISEAEAGAAQVEIKRRLLAVSRRAKGAGETSGGRGRWAVTGSAILVPVAAFGVYALFGSPDVPSLAFADRQEELQENAEIAELTDRLLQRLRSDPQGGPSEGWMLLGQTYMRMGRYSDAASAIEQVIDRPEATSSILSQFAEALIAAENGIVTPKAERAIDRAVEMDPMNPGGVFYKAVALEQAGESAAAHDLLIERLDNADDFAPWMEVFVGQANRIGAALGREPVSLASFAPMMNQGAPGPSQADVDAASEMSEEDRQAFIRSMVERLASRLEQEPGDLDGWLRLGNAYSVLGETEKAVDAYRQAAGLAGELSADDPRRQQIEEALQQLGG